jgi:hypothetical protein
MRRLLLAASAAATLVAGVAPALAQYYGEGYGPPRRTARPYDDGYGGGPYGGPPRVSRVCVTSRGACPSYPLPQGSRCRCEIPGFGSKRGIVGG